MGCLAFGPHTSHYTSYKEIARKVSSIDRHSIHSVQCYVACAVVRCVVLSALALLCCITSLIARGKQLSMIYAWMFYF